MDTGFQVVCEKNLYTAGHLLPPGMGVYCRFIHSASTGPIDFVVQSTIVPVAVTPVRVMRTS